MSVSLKEINEEKKCLVIPALEEVIFLLYNNIITKVYLENLMIAEVVIDMMQQ